MGAQAGRENAIGRRIVAGSGATAGVSDDPAKNAGPEAESADLRIGAVERGHATLFHDAADPGTAGLWADGDDGDLHDGRSQGAGGAGARGAGYRGDRDAAGRERRNYR